MVLVSVLERYDVTGEEVRIIDKILENRYEYAMAHGTLLRFDREVLMDRV